MPQVSIKHFFLDNPDWPPPVAGDNLAGFLTLMGVGRIVFLILGTGALFQWIGGKF